ncbi:COG1180: Radical SAM, Pyruvate-formate lyase-activating enzyme like [Olavius algarvensis associated proteobacterium Delta 3]|nr:COG1180: Radical SAM, Pyruvate-formate lyase-activating enzyme like [Olavius algarvensis associated proteobacterium Delta 3]
MDAYLWEPLDDHNVRCNLCGHRCRIREGKRGICGVRENRGGLLQTLVYGRLIAQNIDPIEKKPLFHFLPGSLSYSIATVGCNFKCRFCQNADIAQMPSEKRGLILGDPVAPENIVRSARRARCATISYTYTEPTIYFETAYDTAILAHEKGIRNVFVTNGYMTPEALDMIGPYLDAANVDLKAYSDDYYKDLCGARLAPVKETLRRMKARGVFIEVTTLLIPGKNDTDQELEALAGFMADELGPETPWHISRFHPTYKLTDRPPTPVQSLLRAREIGIHKGLRYVYTGNVPGESGESTYCHRCGEMLIERWGFTVRKNRVRSGRCPDCDAEIDGVGL